MQSEIRLKYKKAIAKRDYKKALEIVLSDPITFWNPPPDAPVAIQAIATDPLEPAHMIVEWSVMKQECKKPKDLCSEYIIWANQFDHKPKGLTKKKLEEWMQGYIDNRRETKGKSKQLGLTLYLLEVKKVERITDFEGKLIIE
jgi:hypothetical protein